jgi:hypothetical protein
MIVRIDVLAGVDRRDGCNPAILSVEGWIPEHRARTTTSGKR